MYELLKQLKDSGFKQGVGNYLCPHGADCGISTSEGLAWCGKGEPLLYEPTTGELTEELGDFPSYQISVYGRDKDRWEATLVPLQIFGTLLKPAILSIGSTPKEALIKLYIDLNKHETSK